MRFRQGPETTLQNQFLKVHLLIPCGSVVGRYSASLVRVMYSLGSELIHISGDANMGSGMGRGCMSRGAGAMGGTSMGVGFISMSTGSSLGHTFPGSSLTQASGAGGGQLGGCMGEPALAGDHMTGREAGLAPGKAQT